MNWHGFRLFLFAIVLWLGVPELALAQCLKWDVSGAWTFAQSNSQSVDFELQQDGDQIRGSAIYRYYEGKNWRYNNKGSVDGTISDDKMQLTVYWEQGAIGVYNGKISPDGSMEGGTYDKRASDVYALWTSNRTATCSHHAVGVGADGRPAMALGRVRAPAPVVQCPRWDLSSITRMTQTGTAAWMNLKLNQTGFTLAGEAKYIPPRGVFRDKVIGNISGSVTGNEVDFTAAWDDGKAGIYHGSIEPNGRVTGSAYERDKHEESASWSMLDRAVCDTNYHAERTGLRLGRAAPRDPNAPVPSICDASRSARARNSPAAPGLEARCRIVGETTNMAISTLVDSGELDRLAEIGHTIARADYDLGNLRRSNADLLYRHGFDVASALFGDPALGGQGKAAADAESANIRASLDPASQPGFDDSANFHFSRQNGP